MKVLFDAHMLGQKRTGLERYTGNLVRHLAELGKSLDISLYSNLPKSRLPSFYDRFSVFVPSFSHGLYRIFRGFDQAVQRVKPDILHVNFFAPIKKKVPLVVTIHDICFKRFPKKIEPLKNLLTFHFFLGHSLKTADAIICVSDFVKKEIIKYYQLNTENIFVIYEAPDPIFAPKRDKGLVRKVLRKKFNIEGNFFLVVGNIETRKDPLVIVESFKLLAHQKKNIKLVFAGKNKLGEKFLRLVQAASNNKILLLNYVSDEDLVLLYNQALALIQYSVCEGFCLPVVEAMRCKTAVICKNLPVLKEIAQTAAIFVRNRKELYQAMKLLLEESDLKKKYQKLGYKNSLYFSWEKAAKETMRVYTRVLSLKKIS